MCEAFFFFLNVVLLSVTKLTLLTCKDILIYIFVCCFIMKLSRY